MPLPPVGVIVYFLAIAVAKGAGVVGTAFSRLTVMSVGAVPELIRIVLKGLPKLSAAPAETKPRRLTFPTTSVAFVAGPEVAAAGMVNVNSVPVGPVFRSPEVSVSRMLTVAFALSVTPPESLIVRLLSAVVLVGISGPVVMGDDPVYTTFTVAPKVGAALSEPPLREMVAPLPSVRLAPLVNTTSVSVSVPLTVTAALRVTPLELLIVKLLKVVAVA